MRCPKCHGSLEPIIRATKFCFNFCRVCKLAYNEHGALEINTGQLSSGFNPLAASRGIIKKTVDGVSPVARTALEVFLMEGLWECYLQGLKDGVLLAFSQDVERGKPIAAEDMPNGPLSNATRHPK
jgi:hypothetical protein